MQCKSSVLTFKDKYWTEESMQQCAQTICQNQQIDQVYFNNNTFEADAIPAFIQEMTSQLGKKRRMKLAFNDTAITEDEMEKLKELFPHCFTLHFRNAKLSDGAVQTIADYLRSPQCRITTIHLENNRLSAQAHTTLMNALTHNNSVDKLFINNTHDYNKQDFDAAFDAMKNMLKHNTTLRVIGMNESDTPTKYLSTIAEGIEKNVGLQEINIHENIFKADKSGLLTNQLTSAISMNGKITTLGRKLSPSLNMSISKLNKALSENKDRLSEFFNAIHNGDISKTIRILKANYYDLKWTFGKMHYNALHAAVLSNKNSDDMIQLLYRYGFDQLINKRAGAETQSRTPLHLAVIRGNAGIVDALLKIKNNNVQTSVLLKDKKGSSALSLAEDLASKSNDPLSNYGTIAGTLRNAVKPHQTVRPLIATSASSLPKVGFFSGSTATKSNSSTSPNLNNLNEFPTLVKVR